MREGGRRRKRRRNPQTAFCTAKNDNQIVLNTLIGKSIHSGKIQCVSC